VILRAFFFAPIELSSLVGQFFVRVNGDTQWRHAAHTLVERKTLVAAPRCIGIVITAAT
jgi:hypothetical protein